MTGAEFQELIEAHKALQADYEKIGWIKTDVYARSCRALANVDFNMAAILKQLDDGDTAQDFHKHLGRED
jgi:hypothetical protein